MEDHALRSYSDVARIMTDRGYPMSRALVYNLECRVFNKLRSDPVIREFAETLGLEVGAIDPPKHRKRARGQHVRTPSATVIAMAKEFMAREAGR